MKTITNIVKKLFGRDDVSTSAGLTLAVAGIESQLSAARAEREQVVAGELDDLDAAAQITALDSRIRLLTERRDGLRERILETKISEMEAMQADLTGQHLALSMKHYELREAFAASIQKLTPRGTGRGAAREAIARAQLESPEMGKVRLERAEISRRKGDVMGELTQLYKERERRAATPLARVVVTDTAAAAL